MENICEKSDEEKSNLLKKFIHTYFLQKTPGVPPEWKNEVLQLEISIIFQKGMTVLFIRESYVYT